MVGGKLSALYYLLLGLAFLNAAIGDKLFDMKNILKEILKQNLELHFKDATTNGGCGDVKVMPNLDVERFYSGKNLWYEMGKSDNPGTSDCATVKMVAVPGHEKIYFDFRYQQPIDGLGLMGFINANDPNNTYASITFPPDTNASTIYVLDTDYDNYTLIYSCSPEEKERVWLLTQQKEPNNDTRAAIQNAISQQGEDFQNKLLSMDTCEEIHKLEFCRNKTNMKGLDLAKFAEKSWFEQLRSSNDWENQDICANVNYTYDADKKTMTVLYESSGSSIKYLAFKVSKNDSNLIFESNDDNFFYLITDTDYENYTVVYSCDQITKSEKKERLWILGKYNEILEEIVDAISEEYEGIFVKNITCPLPPPTTTVEATIPTTQKSDTSSSTNVISTQNDEGETTNSPSETSSANPGDNDDNRPPSYNISGYADWKFYFLFQLKNE